MKQDIIIAIDGYAGCGKSTTAKEVAKRLSYTFVDSGAMYRAVTLYFLRHEIPFKEDNPSIDQALSKIDLEFRSEVESDLPILYMNDERMEPEIRLPIVSENVSYASVHKNVRSHVVALQQAMGKHKRVVMDGRDIGTVVYPKAELKVFMTARPEVRAARRQAELAKKGIQKDFQEVLDNLLERDHIDSTRKVGPLKKAEGAKEIDTSDMEMKDQIDLVMAWAYELIDLSSKH